MLLAAAVALVPNFRVLVFTKTAGFRHDSIPVGIAALKDLGLENHFEITATEDASEFTSENLKRFRVIVFLSTTGNVLTEPQEQAFEGYIKQGGGFVGIHAAADTEYECPFYGKLVGAYFKSHPQIQKATVNVVDRDHPSTKHLAEQWVRTDEWYCYQAVPPEKTRILAKLDATSYQGSVMGENHPIAWCHELLGGRAWYTGGGHTKESFAEPDFKKHLLGGIQWAAKVRN